MKGEGCNERSLFQNILIADISKKVAKWQQFSKGLNVVTGIDNHVGKSSLLKSLFYALGADVAFDSAWDQNSKIYVATINVDDKTYRIARFSGRFAVFHDEELLIITDRISSELAPLLERIFEFAVYLPNKDTKKWSLHHLHLHLCHIILIKIKDGAGYIIVSGPLQDIKAMIGLSLSIII